MLDVRLELESYQPVHLESIEEKNGELPENIREAILLYNKALEDAKFKNEDMAIIALKKAISLHPGFYEAINLLGICYTAVGMEEAAERTFKQVIDADDSSIKALEYLNKLTGSGEEKDKTDPASARRKSTPSKHPKKSSDKKASDSKTGDTFARVVAKGLEKEHSRFYWLKYIVGIVIGILLVSLIWIMVPTDKSLFTISRDEIIVKNPELEAQIDKLNERIEKLESDLQASKEENTKLERSFEEYKNWLLTIEEADSEYQAGNYLKAAEILTADEGIPDDLAKEHRNLWDKVRTEAANQLYQEGTKLYNDNSAKDPELFRQALEKFESAITYLENDKTGYMPAMYYLAGKAAARCDQIDRAIELFEAIIDEFPSTQYSAYARVRLNEIEEGKPITGN